VSGDAFRPVLNTSLILVSSSTGLAAQQVSSSYTPAVLLSNPSTVAVYIALGTSSIAAGQPTTAAPCPGMCLPAGRERVFSLGPGPSASWCSAVTSAGAAILFSTPGSGQ
jgi:hypothetical protein